MYESLKDGRLECMFYQNQEYRLIFFSLSFDCIRYERFKFVAFGYVARSETCDCVHGPVRNVDLSVLGIHTLVVALFVCGGRRTGRQDICNGHSASQVVVGRMLRCRGFSSLLLDTKYCLVRKLMERDGLWLEQTRGSARRPESKTAAERVEV